MAPPSPQRPSTIGLLMEGVLLVVGILAVFGMFAGVMGLIFQVFGVDKHK